MSTEADRQLLSASERGDASAVSRALDSGASVSTTDSRGRTPLLLASLGDHLDAATALVKAGADPNTLDDQRQSPWLVTGVTGSVPMLELLLTANPKPDLTLRNRFGGVSVIPASERGHVDYVRRVVKTDIDVNHVNNLGWTALLECVILGNGSEKYQEIARILIDAGAKGIADNDGVTPLQHARKRGQKEVAKILEDAGQT